MRLQIGWVLGVALVLCAVLSQSAQASDGRPSRQTLEQMGCGSLAVISDDEALAVRGQGFMGGSYVRVSGASWASIGSEDAGAHSEDSYFAEGKHDAKGWSSSHAGVADIWISGSRGGHKDQGGDWGGMPPRSSDYKPRDGGSRDVHVKIHATIFFAGGHSSAWAF